MKRMLIYSLTALTVATVHSASAAVFERDWQTPGEGLLT